MTRTVSGRDGRRWLVRSYRYRRPPWRPVSPSLGLLDDEPLFLYLPLLLLYVVLAPVTLLVLPLLIFLLEAPTRGVWSLASDRRWVEAVHAGTAPSRMSWTTDAEHARAVVDQIARQIELGYERIQPQNARFRGFDRDPHASSA